MNALNTNFESDNVVALTPGTSIATVDAAVAALANANDNADTAQANDETVIEAEAEPVSPESTAMVPVADAEPVAPRLVAPPPMVTTCKVSALVPRAALAVAVAACNRVVERRNTIPILANVMLRGTDYGLEVIGTDLDIVVTVPVACPVDSSFATTLPAHTLNDLLRKAKASDMVAIDVVQTTTEGKRVHTEHVKRDGVWTIVDSFEAFRDVTESVDLDFAGLTLSLQGLPPADFPTPETPAWLHSFTLPAADLARALGRTEFCISTEETRYYLNGIFMHVPEHSKLRPAMLRFTATDGHKLASAEFPAPDGCDKTMPGIIVPAKAVKELLRLVDAKGAPDCVTVKIAEGGGKMLFTAGDVAMMSKAIDGTFPDYARVVPSGNDKELKVGTEELTIAIKQVTVISSERGRAVKLACEGARLTLSVDNPDTGRAKTSIEVEYNSDPLDIGFNSHYMLDILANIESDAATLMLADAGSPTLIRGAGDADKDCYFVLMPMRV